MMKIYNTLTRSVDALQPINPGKISIYSCGPTVYDHVHIGNLSSFVHADTLRRTINAAGYQTTHVMNLTDVDDKTIARSQVEFPDDEPMKALQNLTKKYTEIFLNDVNEAGNDMSAVKLTKATDYIEQMKQLILDLHKKGIAYVTDDGVYFSISKYILSGKKYGQLTEISAASTSNQRIDNDEYDKDSVHDFALWKEQKEGEPSWDFEIEGKSLPGRPGWHIECSIMSTHNLGQPFDIHTGGVDLKFPHHENEIAQSTAITTTDKYSNIFVHNEHILVEGKKMSKSLNNFYTLEDIKENGNDPLAFRLMVLQAHYRSQLNFSWQNLEAAQNRLKQYGLMADLRHQADFELPESPNNAEYFTGVKRRIISALTEDIDTPQALAILSETENNVTSQHGLFSDKKALAAFEDLLKLVDDVLGLQLTRRQDISKSLKDQIAARDQARADQRWDESDKIRDALAEAGVELFDTPRGTIWTQVSL